MVEENKSDMVMDEMTVNQMKYTLDYLTRRSILRQDESRDFYQIFGYDEDLSDADYYVAYQRDDIANRVISAYPSAIWSNPPTVTNDNKTEADTDWDKAWKKLNRKHKIFPTLKRFDKLTQLGEFAILVFGIKGTGKLETPLNIKGGKKHELAYLTPYGSKDIVIEKFEENQNSPRFGLPVLYKVTIEVPTDNEATLLKEFKVHHTRVLHNAEDILDIPWKGSPKLRVIMNRLMDLKKVVGGGAETFWLNGRGGLVANADKDTHMEDPEKLKEEFQRFSAQLTRYIATKGIDTKVLSTPVPDPEPQFRTIMSLISGATGIPQRILLGAEAGELASTQDKLNWQDRVDERRNDYSEPDVLIPFIDKMIEIGELADDEFVIEWQPLGDTDEKTKAEVAQKLSTAISSYINSPGASFIIPPKQFVEEILNLPYRSEDIEKTKGVLEEQVIRSSDATKQAGQPASTQGRKSTSDGES